MDKNSKGMGAEKESPMEDRNEPNGERGESGEHSMPMSMPKSGNGAYKGGRSK